MIYLDNRSGEELPLEEYEKLAEFVLEQEAWDSRDGAWCPSFASKAGTASPVPPVPAHELSISLVDLEEMHALNREYRGIDAPTDVLAFENDDELLGDVVVCPAVAREHAQDFDSSFAGEMALMLTHGILHLLGYDHINDADAEVMEARENELLKLWEAG